MPLAAGASSAWVFDSWDRFQVPKPFARVVLVYGTPITVPPRLPEDEVEVWRVRIECAMREAAAEADRLAAGIGPTQ